MRHGSLFSGIGGFDLAAEWMGWENVFHCEWNPFGQRVLHHYWPQAETFTDITKADFTKYYGTVDIISGGFPCQPYSTAGKRLGKDDSRHLWPQMLRAIREISPRYIVGENVRGLLNWNGGMVFEEVCADLESYGYQVAPVVIPACGVGAAHRRERVWFVAHTNNTGSHSRFREIQETNGEIPQRNNYAKFGHTNAHDNWDQFPTQSPFCGGDDGLPSELDGITFPMWRNESIKAYGNAIVPQVAYQIFKAITKTI